MKESYRERMKLVLSLGHRKWRSAGLVHVPGATRNCTHLLSVTDEDGHPLENEDDSGRRFCESWGIEGERGTISMKPS